LVNASQVGLVMRFFAQP